MIDILKQTLTRRNFFTSLIVSLALLVAVPILMTSGTSYAQPAKIKQSVNCGGNKISLGDNCNPADTKGSGPLETLIKNIINVLSAIVGAICVVMIIIGGFRYVTSGGESNAISGAKNTILYAIVGLIIVAFAQVIVQFVLQRTTGPATAATTMLISTSKKPD